MACVLVLSSLVLRGETRLGDRADESSARSSAATLERPSFAPDETELQDCDRLAGTCLGQALGNLAYATGPTAAIAVLERSLRDGTIDDAACHEATYGMGRGAFAGAPGDLAKLVALGSQACASGYYHGVLTDAFAGASPAKVQLLARQVCSSRLLADSDRERNACGHGLGHGLMAQSGRRLDSALETCAALEDRDQSWCYGGAFMELFLTGESVGPEVCRGMAPRYQYECYVGAMDGLRQRHGEDWMQIGRACSRQPRHWVDTCFLALGRHAGTFHVGHPQRVVTACERAASGAHRHVCLVHAAGQVAGMQGHDRDAKRLCAATHRPGREQCSSIVAGVMAGSNGPIA
jgi:hypothetical protein